MNAADFGQGGKLFGRAEVLRLQRLPFLFAVTIEPGIVAAVRVTHQVCSAAFSPDISGWRRSSRLDRGNANERLVSQANCEKCP